MLRPAKRDEIEIFLERQESLQISSLAGGTIKR